MTLLKGDMINALPIHDGDLTIRAWVREDAEVLGTWPSYPPDYAAFNLAYRTLLPADRERRFASREADPARVDLMADLLKEPVIAYLALVEINWAAGCIGNMAFRVNPARCDQGLGTRILQLVTRWCFEKGMSRLRLDVAAANPGAMRCYEKGGYVLTSELWREEPRLQGVDLSEREYALLRPHVRYDGPVPQVRFYWMECALGNYVKDVSA